MRILIVDDNEDAADSLAALLSLDGYEVRVAYTGESALEFAREIPPDVVFLDIGMPEMDGLEVCRRLRSDCAPNEKRHVIVAVTGWGTQADRQRTREAGFDAHLVKPVEPHALQGLLQAIERANPARQRPCK